MKANIAGARGRGSWVRLPPLLVMAVLPVSALAAAADPSGGPDAKGHTSSAEEVQADPSGPSPRGIPMPGSQRDPDAEPRAELRAPVSAMEQMLRRPRGASRGELPPVSSVPAVQPTGSDGGQIGAAPKARSSRRSLKLVLKVRDDGTSEVVSATEVRGETAVSEEALGDYIYEVTDGNRSVSVQAIPDPFVAHSFGGPEDEKRGHAEFRTKEADVVVTIPGLGLDSRLDRLELRLYKLKPGAPVERVNAAVLARLKADTRLELLAAPATPKLVEQIRRRGSRAGD